METIRYWCKALGRALWSTCTFWGWNKKSLVFPILSAIGFLIYWRLQGLEAMKEELAIFFAFVLAPIGGFTLLLFFWNVIVTPLRMEQDAKKTANENKAKLESEKTSLQTQLNKLREKEAKQVEEHKVFEIEVPEDKLHKVIGTPLPKGRTLDIKGKWLKRKIK